MTKKLISLLLLLVLVGCSHYDRPGDLFRDPHFGQYKEQQAKLESQYLNKEMSYADYMKQRDELDAKYDKEVSERDSKINY